MCTVELTLLRVFRYADPLWYRGHYLDPYGYNIWGHFNFPMFHPHWPVCKYGPHLFAGLMIKGRVS